jgi:uncharacterized membrane protein
MDPIRLVTVHPALVHVTLGTLPVIVISYAIAHRHQSERWTFVGDATLAISAVATLLAVALGIISFVRIDWVGSSGVWRWVHLVVGVVASVLLLTFALIRARRRSRHPVTARGALVAAIAVAAVTGVAGWIGGEILVFRGGAGVIAAGGGVLAPPTGPQAASRGLVDLMDRIRERWAVIVTETSTMVAVAPRDAAFARVATSADQLAALGDALAARYDATDDLPRAFAAGAHHLAAAARSRDLAAISTDLGKTTAACAGCHDETR